MKYKDIYALDLFTTHEEKVRMAIRVYQAKLFIREAINAWLGTGEEPTLEVNVAPSHWKGESVLLSTQFLIHNSGMNPLDALLFIDWAIRDDAGAVDALETWAKYRSTPFQVKITEDMWKKIDPEVLREYEKLRQERIGKLKVLEDAYQLIKEEDLTHRREGE